MVHPFFKKKKRHLKTHLLLGFLNWRMPGTHGACVDIAQKIK
jgi:hypothetical protein